MTETPLSLLADIAKIVLPAGLCLGMAYLMFRQMIQAWTIREEAEARAKFFGTYLPLKLSAYERAILFLERIHPEQLLVRAEPGNKNAKYFAEQLIMEISAEYEHNIVQQLYISSYGWNMLVNAKTEMIGIIRGALKRVPDNAKAIDLAEAIFILIRENEIQLQSIQAIEQLKLDVKNQFDR